MAYGTCTQCGCTDNDCRQCIEASGEPCFWVDNEHQICSRCYIEACERDLDPEQMEKLKEQLQQIKSSQSRTFTFDIKLNPEEDKKLRDFLISIPSSTEEQFSIPANAVCNKCGTSKENPKNAFCINGHDDWIEIEDSEAICSFAEKNGYKYSEVIDAIFNNTGLKIKQ